MQGARQRPVSHRHHHLDDPGHAGRSLGVTDVRLDRPEQQRPAVHALLSVGRHERLRLDRVTQPRPRTVRLDHVDLGRGKPRRGECLPDDTLLGRTVRGRHAVRRAVLVDRRTSHDRQDLVTVSPRVRQPLHQQHPDAFAPARAVRRIGERLAPAVLGQTTLTGELDERPGRRHHRDATGQGQ